MLRYLLAVSQISMIGNVAVDLFLCFDICILKVMETNCILPEDLFEGILSRLQVRDLLRLRCVSKSWRALIDDPCFIWKQHCVQYAMHKANGDVPLLLWKRLSSIEGPPNQCSLLSKQQGYDTVLNWIPDVERDTYSILPNDPDIHLQVFCRGSSNGIICFEFNAYDVEGLGRDSFTCGLWNPASRDFKIVAYPHVPDQLTRGHFCVAGFGFDPLSNDFKIVARTAVVSDVILVYMVYTLSTDSWKRVHVPCLLGSNASGEPSTMDTCLNGVYYWTASLLHNENCIFRILSFNFSTELFRFSDPPQEALPLVYRANFEFMYDIGLYNECLALFFTRSVFGVAGASVDIWVVTQFDDDFGVPLAWQCLISIKTTFELGPSFRAQRIDGDLLFSTYFDGLSLYNPTTGMFRNLGVDCDFCFRYVGSLYPLSRRVVQR